jgi:hypothetical protein
VELSKDKDKFEGGRTPKKVKKKSISINPTMKKMDPLNFGEPLAILSGPMQRSNRSLYVKPRLTVEDPFNMT